MPCWIVALDGNLIFVKDIKKYFKITWYFAQLFVFLSYTLVALIYNFNVQIIIFWPTLPIQYVYIAIMLLNLMLLSCFCSFPWLSAGVYSLHRTPAESLLLCHLLCDSRLLLFLQLHLHWPLWQHCIKWHNMVWHHCYLSNLCNPGGSCVLLQCNAC